MDTLKNLGGWISKHIEDAITSFSAKSFVEYATSLSCFMWGLYWIIGMEGDWKTKVGLGTLLTTALFGFQALLTSRSIFSDLDLPDILKSWPRKTTEVKAPEVKNPRED